MAVERNTGAEQGNFETPTNLSLFQFKKAEIPDLDLTHQSAMAFKLQFGRQNQLFYGQLEPLITQVDENLNQAQEDLMLKYQNLSALIVTHLAYEAIREDLIEAGGSEEDALRMFELCFQINCAAFAQGDHSRSFLGLLKIKARTPQLPQFLQNKEADRLGVGRLFRELLKNPPSCFVNDNHVSKNWPGFAANHAIFSLMYAGKEESAFATSPDLLPQWLKDARESGQAPSFEKIEEEYYKDREARNAIVDQHNANVHIKDNLIILRDRLFSQSLSVVEKQRRQVFPVSSNSLADLLIKLNSYEAIWVIEDDEQRIATAKFADLKRYSPKEYRIRAINTFAENSPEAADQRMIALFLENSLKKAGISSSDKIDADLAHTFAFLFDVLSGEDPNEEAYATLKEVKPLLHQILEAFRPLLTVLASDKQKEAKATIARGFENKEKLSDLLWRLSGLFAENAQQEDQILQQISQFSKEWLEKNWEGAYQLLTQALPPLDEEEIQIQETPITTQIKILEEEIAKLAL